MIDRLRSCWSPEQVAGRLRLAGHSGFRVSHETIYRYVYGAGGKQKDLYRLLPWSRRSPRGGRRPRGLKIPLTNSIGQRPMAIARREEFDHWEGDLVAFRQATASLTSHCWWSEKAGLPFSGAIGPGFSRRHGWDLRAARPLPSALRQSVTFDRGTEFAAYPTLRSELGMSSYFSAEIALAEGGRRELLRPASPVPAFRHGLAARDSADIVEICSQLHTFRHRQRTAVAWFSRRSGEHCLTVLAMGHRELSQFDALMRVERGALRVEDAATRGGLKRRQPSNRWHRTQSATAGIHLRVVKRSGGASLAHT